MGNNSNNVKYSTLPPSEIDGMWYNRPDSMSTETILPPQTGVARLKVDRQR